MMMPLICQVTVLVFKHILEKSHRLHYTLAAVVTVLI